MLITSDSIEDFRKYLASGRWEEDFEYRTPDGQAEMLDMLDALFNLCELADDILTKKLYKNMRGEGRTVPFSAASLLPSEPEK